MEFLNHQIRAGVEMIRKLQAVSDALASLGGPVAPVMVLQQQAFDLIDAAFVVNAHVFPLSTRNVVNDVTVLCLQTARSQITVYKEIRLGQEAGKEQGTDEGSESVATEGSGDGTSAKVDGT